MNSRNDHIAKSPHTTSDEENRLTALRSYNILDTATEQDYDELTELAAAICDVPIALISLMDRDRQWFKSHKGLDISEVDRSLSFCTHNLLHPGELMEVQNAHKDERFRSNPYVTGEPHIVFYAGIPLTDTRGNVLGSLCVLDHRERQLSAVQQQALRILSGQIIEKLEARKQLADLQVAQAQLLNMQTKLEGTQIRLNMAIEGANLGLWTLDLNTRRLEVNTQYRKMMGLPPDTELTIESVLPVVDPAYIPAIKKIIEEGIARQTDADFVYPITHSASGGKKWIKVLGRVHLDKTGRPDKFIGVNIDITSDMAKVDGTKKLNDELQSTIAKLKQSEGRLNLAIASASLGTWHIDARTRQFDPSPRLKELFGYHPDEAMTYEAALAQIVDAHREWVIKAMEDAMTKNAPFDLEYPIIGFHDKQLRWVKATGRLYNTTGEPGGGTFSGTMVDITQQTQHQQAIEDLVKELNEKEENLRLTIQAAKLGTYNLDTLTGVVTINEYCRNIFGFPSTTAVTAERGFNLMAEDKDRINEAINTAILYGSVFDEEYRITREVDGETRWVRSVGRALKTADGKKLNFYGTLADITDSKAAEQRKTDFISIVSHELRTPLTSLNGYIYLINQEAKEANIADILDFAAKAQRQISRMEKLVTGFLDLTRMQAGQFQLQIRRFDMADLVKIAESESVATVTSHKVIFHPVEYTPVNADQDKIEQVLINFINNAVKYSAPGTTINVSSVNEKGKVRVCVKDEGMGITAFDQQHIFDRFYRVDNEHSKSAKGFGIGLYICKEIIERHCGTIGVISAPGEGSTFWFELPTDF